MLRKDETEHKPINSKLKIKNFALLIQTSDLDSKTSANHTKVDFNSAMPEDSISLNQSQAKNQIAYNQSKIEPKSSNVWRSKFRTLTDHDTDTLSCTDFETNVPSIPRPGTVEQVFHKQKFYEEKTGHHFSPPTELIHERNYNRLTDSISQAELNQENKNYKSLVHKVIHNNKAIHNHQFHLTPRMFDTSVNPFDFNIVEQNKRKNQMMNASIDSPTLCGGIPITNFSMKGMMFRKDHGAGFYENQVFGKDFNSKQILKGVKHYQKANSQMHSHSEKHGHYHATHDPAYFVISFF